LAWNRYGKSHVRLVKVRRASVRDARGRGRAAAGEQLHELIDLTVDVQLEGDFDAVYRQGDNRSCIATDTMKNTVYALARQDPIAHVESFAIRLAEYFGAQPGVARARISAYEHRWERVTAGGRLHPHAFHLPGNERWTTVVTREGGGSEVISGLTNLVVLKTTGSAFSGFPRDRYTTLQDTDDRILATSVTANWRYRRGTRDFGARARIRQRFIETFAEHDSRSVQDTLYAMAEAALDACDEVSEVTLRLPNRHHLLADLTPFGLDNPHEIFVATDEPYGLIEATVKR
jgi:urate oxidase